MNIICLCYAVAYCAKYPETRLVDVIKIQGFHKKKKIFQLTGRYTERVFCIITFTKVRLIARGL